MTKSLIRYIGGKNRIAKHIVKALVATDADTMIDVFGGSGAVIMAAGKHFLKRIYNDADGDMANLFSVIGDDELRPKLLRKLKWTPPSRKIFEDDYKIYLRNGFSFRSVECPVERARMIFYRSHFSFGGKIRSGGFSISTGDAYWPKEVGAYVNSLRRLVAARDFWIRTAIENMDFSECISKYGRREKAVLFCDPPYVGTENYYAHEFPIANHTFLAHQLAECRSHVVLTYYDHPLLRELYPDDLWEWVGVPAVKNSCCRRPTKERVTEYIIIKRQDCVEERKAS